MYACMHACMRACVVYVCTYVSMYACAQGDNGDKNQPGVAIIKRGVPIINCDIHDMELWWRINRKYERT